MISHSKQGKTMKPKGKTMKPNDSDDSKHGTQMLAALFSRCIMPAKLPVTPLLSGLLLLLASSLQAQSPKLSKELQSVVTTNDMDVIVQFTSPPDSATINSVTSNG